MINPYEALANAIIINAVTDYRRCDKELKRLKLKRDNRLKWKIRELNMELKNIEKFFDSEWYMQLTGANSKYILPLLKEECR